MFGPQRLLDLTNSAVLALDEDLDFFRLGILIFQVDSLGCMIVLSCSLRGWQCGWCDVCWMPVDDRVVGLCVTLTVQFLDLIHTLDDDVLQRAHLPRMHCVSLAIKL